MRHFFLILMLAGCAEPLVHQRALGTMHSQVAQQCEATPTICATVKPCAEGLRSAITAWQGVSTAIAQGDDEMELARTADAMTSEGAARTTCLVTMPVKGNK